LAACAILMLLLVGLGLLAQQRQALQPQRTRCREI
jgi:hypothetical protein